MTNKKVPDESASFSRSSKKTYNLMEIVKAPLTMVDKGPEDTIFSFPVVAVWEAVLFLGMMAFLLIFSLIKDAPLEELANPLITTDPAKAPWYFMGLQELLEHMHPFLAGIALPGILVTFLILIPYIDTSKIGSGQWFTSPRGKKITFWTTIYTLIVMPIFVVLDYLYPPRELFRDTLPDVVTQWIIPFGVLLILSLLPTIHLRLVGKGKYTTRELLLSLFTVMLVAAIILTLIGFFFRGPGFKMFWPWDMPAGYNPLNNL